MRKIDASKIEQLKKNAQENKRAANLYQAVSQGINKVETRDASLKKLDAPVKRAPDNSAGINQYKKPAPSVDQTKAKRDAIADIRDDYSKKAEGLLGGRVKKVDNAVDTGEEFIDFALEAQAILNKALDPNDPTDITDVQAFVNSSNLPSDPVELNILVGKALNIAKQRVLLGGEGFDVTDLQNISNFANQHILAKDPGEKVANMFLGYQSLIEKSLDPRDPTNAIDVQAYSSGMGSLLSSDPVERLGQIFSGFSAITDKALDPNDPANVQTIQAYANLVPGLLSGLDISDEVKQEAIDQLMAQTLSGDAEINITDVQRFANFLNGLDL